MALKKYLALAAVFTSFGLEGIESYGMESFSHGALEDVSCRTPEFGNSTAQPTLSQGLHESHPQSGEVEEVRIRAVLPKKDVNIFLENLENYKNKVQKARNKGDTPAQIKASFTPLENIFYNLKNEKPVDFSSLSPEDKIQYLCMKEYLKVQEEDDLSDRLQSLTIKIESLVEQGEDETSIRNALSADEEFIFKLVREEKVVPKTPTQKQQYWAMQRIREKRAVSPSS